MYRHWVKDTWNRNRNNTTNIDDHYQFVFSDDRMTKDPCISLFEMPVLRKILISLRIII